MRPIAALAVLAALSSVAAAAQPVPGPGTASVPSAAQVVVTYFHGDLRCATCRKLEALSKETVEANFAKEIAAGAVTFRAINTDRPEHHHFVKDYELASGALVVSEEAGGTVLRWNRLDKVWLLVRGDRQAFDDYVVAGVRAYLGPAS
jgi:hypothetical protein